MSDESPAIECPTHGRCGTATVCGHLVRNSGPPLGFIENSAEPGDLQGWCFACEYVFLQEEDRTARFRDFNRMAVVCAACYADIKARHEIAD